MLIKLLKALWRLACELSDDNAYAHYLQHHVKAHPQLPPLSSKAFFEQQQARKWNSINHCC